MDGITLSRASPEVPTGPSIIFTVIESRQPTERLLILLLLLLRAPSNFNEVTGVISPIFYIHEGNIKQKIQVWRTIKARIQRSQVFTDGARIYFNTARIRLILGTRLHSALVVFRHLIPSL